jgi:hypothetical protein
MIMGSLAHNLLFEAGGVAGAGGSTSAHLPNPERYHRAGRYRLAIRARITHTTPPAA